MHSLDSQVWIITREEKNGSSPGGGGAECLQKRVFFYLSSVKTSAQNCRLHFFFNNVTHFFSLAGISLQTVGFCSCLVSVCSFHCFKSPFRNCYIYLSNFLASGIFKKKYKVLRYTNGAYLRCGCWFCPSSHSSQGVSGGACASACVAAPLAGRCLSRVPMESSARGGEAAYLIRHCGADVNSCTERTAGATAELRCTLPCAMGTLMWCECL